MRLLWGVSVLALALACARPAPVDPRVPPAAREGAEPLSLTLKRVGGGEVALAALRGRVVMLYAFTTWCYPCLAELEELKARYPELRAAGVDVYGIGLDLEGPKVLRAFAEAFEIPFPILVGAGDVLDAKTPLGRLSPIPAVFLLDRGGRVIGYRLGVGAKDWIDQTLARAKTAG